MSFGEVWGLRRETFALRASQSMVSTAAVISVTKGATLRSVRGPTQQPAKLQ
jgi:hypothetical protein